MRSIGKHSLNLHILSCKGNRVVIKSNTNNIRNCTHINLKDTPSKILQSKQPSLRAQQS